MNIDPNATKYLIKAKITADGIVEKPDVVGAVFGQTEGLLGDDLDLRDLQKSGRIGRIEVEIVSKGGKSDGIIYIASSLDQVETVILASALETVDRVGPCKANIRVLGIEDVRIVKREKVVERAKELLNDLITQSKGTSSDLTQSIRQSIQVEEITSYGKDRCPAGPDVKDAESIIIVEGRSDVLNLLKAGIKNSIAVEGTNVPKTVQDLSKERVAIAFVDGDRGGELILKELFQTSEIDFVARAPRAHEVEELTAKQIVKCLRNKVPGDQYMEMNGLVTEEKEFDEDGNIRDVTPSRESSNANNNAGRHEHDDRRNRDDRSRRNRDDRKKETRPRDPDLEGGDRKGRFNQDNADRFKKKREVSEPVADEPVSEAVEEDEPVRKERRDRTEDEPARKERNDRSEDEPVRKERRDREEDRESRPKKERQNDSETKDADEKPARTLHGKKDRNTKTLSPEQEAFRDILLDMSSTHNAKLLDAENNILREVAVKNLVNSLKEDSENISSIVFDGVISQRILDVSTEKGIRTIVGTRKGNIAKMSADIIIWTKEDLY
ncbi:MAG: DNA primase [Candidatus Methanoplasma sp.]|jgi:DNA primase|nr:DNA primase [Candidatus Methanoplasma sp.]